MCKRACWRSGTSKLTLIPQIITSCLPVLRPLLEHIPRKLIALLPFSSTRRTDQDPTSTAHYSPSSGNCFKMLHPKTPNTDPIRSASKPTPSSKVDRIKTTLRGSSSEEIISPMEVQRPEEALVRSESNGSEWNIWRNSGVLKTVEVDVESSYVLSPTSPRATRSEFGGHGVGRALVTRYEWE